MKNNILILGFIFIITISVVSFIHFSNDHTECKTEITKYKDSKGNLVKEEKHICNEKYNF